ncbi:MAG: hypothetical protein KKD28_07760 [Chloroflexi bacterium]|nr:hypothetical protein [Chloroflexota bacterium]
MDGHFVPNISMGRLAVEACRSKMGWMALLNRTFVFRYNIVEAKYYRRYSQ